MTTYDDENEGKEDHIYTTVHHLSWYIHFESWYECFCKKNIQISLSRDPEI